MAVKQMKERGIYEKVPGSGIWWVRYAAADGKEHRELGGKFTDARALVERRRTEKRRGVVPEIKGAPKPKLEPAKVMTFGDLINDTLAYSASNNDETHTHELDLKYRKMGDLAKMPPAHVTRTVIKNCLNELAEKKKWADPTYNRYLASISLVFRIAIENEKLTVNPVHGIRRKQENSDRVRFLSQEEEVALTPTIQSRNPDYVPVYLLAMHSGMRLSEQLRAQVGDYSPTTGVLLVRQKKVRNAPATRYVPLTPIGVEAYNLLAAGAASLQQPEWWPIN